MAYIPSSQQVSELPYDRNFWLDLHKTNDPFVRETGWMQVISGKKFADSWEDQITAQGITPYITHKNKTVEVIEYLDVYRERYGSKTGFYECIVDENQNPVPIPRPASILEELERYKIGLMARSSARRTMVRFTGEHAPEIDDIDLLLRSWNPDDGLLLDRTEVNRSALFDSLPQDAYAKGYAVDREYFFAVPSENNFIISIANQLNRNTPLFGIRRNFRQDWPPYFRYGRGPLPLSEVPLKRAVQEYTGLLEELVELMRV